MCLLPCSAYRWQARKRAVQCTTRMQILIHLTAPPAHGYTRHRHAVGARACTQVPNKESGESEWKIMPCSPSVEGCLQMSIMQLATAKDEGLSPQPA